MYKNQNQKRYAKSVINRVKELSVGQGDIRGSDRRFSVMAKDLSVKVKEV
jgi:hypothetical protein